MRKPTAAAFFKIPTSKGAAALLDDSENPFVNGAAAAVGEIKNPFGNGAAAPGVKL